MNFMLNMLLCCAVLSHFSRVQLLAILWTLTHRDPLSMRFSRQEYWSGLPYPPPGDPPHPGIKPMSRMSPALAEDLFTTSAAWGAPFIWSISAVHWLSRVWWTLCFPMGCSMPDVPPSPSPGVCSNWLYLKVVAGIWRTLNKVSILLINFFKTQFP